MNENDIFYFINNQLWKKIIDFYQPEKIVKLLTFKDGLRLAYRLLYNDKWDDSLQNYAVRLLYALRDTYSNDWNASWKHNALLGLACDITYRHEERYQAYKKAFDSIDEPPPRLLIEFARCSICPGSPPFSYDKAIELVMKALQDILYADGISLLCNLYSLKNDEAKKDYWSKILEDLNNSGQKLNSPSIEPKFLVEEYMQDRKI